MSRLQVYSDVAAGGDRVCLDQLGQVQALRILTNQTGDLSATWQMYLDTRTDHAALTPGRFVSIPIAASAWQGVMGLPQRGASDLWTFNAFGLPWLTKTYDAIAPTTGNALKLDEILDAAISRGLPFTRPAAMPSLAAGQQGSGFGKVNDALNQVCDAKGQTWTVNRNRQITAGPRVPTTLAYILMASDTAGGRYPTGFVTDVDVTYIDSSDYAQKTITRSATTRPFGRYEMPLDLTGLGAITTTQANSHGDNYLAKNGARVQFTGAFVVPAGQLLSPGGTSVDYATVQASDGTVRAMLVDPDTAAGETSTGPVTLPVGQTEYDVDADVLYLTPLDRTPTGLLAVFAA